MLTNTELYGIDKFKEDPMLAREYINELEMSSYGLVPWDWTEWHDEDCVTFASKTFADMFGMMAFAYELRKINELH